MNLLCCDVSAVNKHQCSEKMCSSVTVNLLVASEIVFLIIKREKQFPLIKSVRADD